jgi:uroporphyrinogen-III synthase
MKLLILRPQPGAAATATRAAEQGLDTVLSPLFKGRALAWQPPDPSAFDALFVTSANAIRYASPALASYRHLPVHAVGPASAAVAREAGFSHVTAGSGDAATLFAELARGTDRRLLHLCGAHRKNASAPSQLRVHHVAVYAMESVRSLTPLAEQACQAGAVAMIHSPRAAQVFGTLADAAGFRRDRKSLVAISAAAAEASRFVWREVVASPAPTDTAMLAIARALCDNRGS